METGEYLKTLAKALEKRRAWIEETQLENLKERLQAFYKAYNALYLFFIKKGLIKEDPYKNENSIEIGKVRVPKTANFSEGSKIQELSVRLSDYDTQLNILSNFFPLSVDILHFDNINTISGLVKYVDWPNLTSESDYPMTKAVAEIRKQVLTDPDHTVLNAPESLAKFSDSILNGLKVMNQYNREYYKYELRTAATAGPPSEKPLTLPEMKKRLAAVKPSSSFYAELAEEVIKEDYTPEGPRLREEVLKSLGVPEKKQKAAPASSNRYLLMDGIQFIGSIANLLKLIGEKFDYNKYLLEDPEPDFWLRVKRFIDKMMNKEPEPAVYELEFREHPAGNQPKPLPEEVKIVKKKVIYEELRADLDKKSQNLASMSFQGPSLTRFEALPEEELLSFLERAIKGISNLYKLLTALDNFFKTKVDEKYRDRVRGIKPELSAMKNAFIKATEKSAEYAAQKESEEVRKWMPKPQAEDDEQTEPEVQAQ
jgi:hypothetical protein